MITKPMLSATVHKEELDKLDYPLICSPKLDGIRCLLHPTLGAVTRSFKPVPNVYIREDLARLAGDQMLDGELLALDDDMEPLDFNTTQSHVMTRGGQPSYTFAVFDCFEFPDQPFAERLGMAHGRVYGINHPRVMAVTHTLIQDREEFEQRALRYLEEGFEGTMIRSVEGPYKSGRSTLNQGWLVKYKEWSDAEGTVVGFEERMHNANEDQKDNFGYAKRSSHQENMVPMGTLGALILDTVWGELRVGTGFDDFMRDTIWHMQGGTLGKTVTFKYQPFGMQDKPRFPVFKHFREKE
jgi:DNA ligase-1